jgi:hypothetical protein
MENLKKTMVWWILFIAYVIIAERTPSIFNDFMYILSFVSFLYFSFKDV